MHCFRLTQQSASLLIILFTIPDSGGGGVGIIMYNMHIFHCNNIMLCAYVHSPQEAMYGFLYTFPQMGHAEHFQHL